jgi:hypothetical protein
MSFFSWAAFPSLAFLPSMFASSAYLAWLSDGTQHGANNFGCQFSRFRLKFGDRFLLVFFEESACLLHLFLRVGSRSIDCLGANLCCLLATIFEVPENLLTGFAQALFVVGGAGLGGGDIGTRFFHRTLGSVATFREHGPQGPVNKKGI